MDLVPAPAVRLMERRVLSRPGVNCLLVAWSSLVFTIALFLFARAKKGREDRGYLTVSLEAIDNRRFLFIIVVGEAVDCFQDK